MQANGFTAWTALMISSTPPGKNWLSAPGAQPRARDRARSVQSLASVSTINFSAVSMIVSTVRRLCEDLTMTAMIKHRN